MTDSTATSTSANLESAWAFAAEHADRFETELFDLLRIPSISTQTEHAGDCRAAADWLAEDLDRIGMDNVQVFETPGLPIVYADWLKADDDAPTVLIYGHYDVQPPDPLEEWTTPPFEPTRADGNVYARGSSDDKGQLYLHLKSLESCLATGGLPVNVKVFLEGEEESGSVSLDPFIEANKDLLEADVAVVSDSHMLSATQPSIITSLRGMTYAEVIVDGPTHDLHSGTFGGAVRNPAEHLSRMIAKMKDDNGRILVPGFYDDVIELTDADREALARVPIDDAHVIKETGAPDVFGEAGYTSYERTGARPTLEINGISGGYAGEGAKTVLPARAMAKVSMRLVANQKWDDIFAKFKAFAESMAEPGVTVTVNDVHGGNPSLVDIEHPAIWTASNALEKVIGTKPLLQREGGSIPVVTTFSDTLGIPTVLVGFGLPDDRLHSPNEKFSLSQFHTGIKTASCLWHELRTSMSA